MASEAGGESLSLRNGVRCVTDNGVLVKEVLLAVGEQVGCDNIYSVSRMNKAVVVFVKKTSLGSALIKSRIIVRGSAVRVTPLSTPATRVVISNVPPFIQDKVIMRELARFGRFGSQGARGRLGRETAAAARGHLDLRPFQYLQSLIFAIEEINNSSSLLPGISLGYKVYDTCGSPAWGAKVSMALVNGNENSDLDEICTKPAQVQAIIGETHSSVSMAIAQSIGPFSIPLISHYSTCECLSDKRKYPSFLRTIPSDLHQSRALAEMVKHFGWTWVGAIRRDDDYGNNGMAAFTEAATQMGICLEYSLPYFKTYSNEKVLKIIQQIKSSTARVIVAFLAHGDLEILLHDFFYYNITGYQWVGTEGWISDSELPTKDTHHILQGAIGLAIPKTTVAGLKDFILNIKPLKSVSRPIFTKFWEALFKCKYAMQNDSSGFQLCTGDEKLSEMENTFTDMSLMPIFSNVYKAVYAVAHTLHELLGCKQTCPTKKQPDPFTVSL
ncbi:extracellular calcium-sensing receptor-like [Clarias gariepinus]